jgi:RNA polymerase sigma-70 factor (ECF subfamily)
MDAIGADNELMSRVRAGDRVAFETLYHRYRARVYASAWRLMRDESAAADLSQEAFFRLWQGREQWEGNGSVAAYLIQVTRNLAYDGHRRQLVHERWREAAANEDSPRAPSPEVLLAQEDVTLRVRDAIDSLPKRPREVFVLKRDAGLSYREIAEILGISPRTVELHMGKALRLLRETLVDLRGSVATR